MSNIQKPPRLTLEGWQLALRQQQATKEPEASRRLVDTLVREDPATGQASINIPVSGKESVLQFVSLLGKLLK